MLIRRQQEFYGNTIEMNQLQTIITILLIFLLITILQYNTNNTSTSFKFKQQITGQTGNGGTKDVEIMIPLKYLSNFWRALEMPLINCKISLRLKWSNGCFLVASTVANQKPEFKITDTKIYFPVITLTTA